MDEDLLICDFAEEYGIIDYRALTPFQAGALAYGLRPDSRIRMKAAGIDPLPETLIMTRIADNLSVIRWYLSEDGHNGVNRPELLTPKIIKQEEETGGYDTPEEFMRAYYGE